jgi:hypothetical protein
MGFVGSILGKVVRTLTLFSSHFLPFSLFPFVVRFGKTLQALFFISR